MKKILFVLLCVSFTIMNFSCEDKDGDAQSVQCGGDSCLVSTFIHEYDIWNRK